MNIRICKACGSHFDLDAKARRLTFEDKTPVRGDGWYCYLCADELLRGIIHVQHAETFPSGAGCPLEPNDDAGPWGENAIREMERDE